MPELPLWQTVAVFLPQLEFHGSQVFYRHVIISKTLLTLDHINKYRKLIFKLFNLFVFVCLANSAAVE